MPRETEGLRVPLTLVRPGCCRVRAVYVLSSLQLGCRLKAVGYWADGGVTTKFLRPASSNARRTMPDAFASSIKTVA
jgi:hypothetical protein